MKQLEINVVRSVWLCVGGGKYYTRLKLRGEERGCKEKDEIVKAV